MTIPPCPTCGDSSPKFLYEVSDPAAVMYYRCDRCRTVWHIPRGESGPVIIVDQPKNRLSPGTSE